MPRDTDLRSLRKDGVPSNSHETTKTVNPFPPDNQYFAYALYVVRTTKGGMEVLRNKRRVKASVHHGNCKHLNEWECRADCPT